MKAALDQVVVTPALVPGEERGRARPTRSRSTRPATDYLVPDYYEIGRRQHLQPGRDVDLNGQFPLLHVSLHTPKYAVVNICPVDQEAGRAVR